MKKKLPVIEAVAACGATLEECSTAMRRIGEAINPKNMKKSKVKLIPVDQLELNEGQLEWLPRNPRQWTQTDIDRMRASLAEDPDFPEERPVLAVPSPDGKLIVFAHNLLTKVAKLDGSPEQLPTVVYFPESDEDQEAIRRRALKDNGQFGSWDTEILADEWADYEPEVLEEMGIPDWVTGGSGSAQQTGASSGTGARSGAPAAKEDEGFNPDAGILVRCKPGDVWQLGDHRLMCGDSTDLETVKSLIGGGIS